MFDCHYDLLTYIFMNKDNLEKVRRHFKKIFEGNITGGIFNLFYMSPREMKEELNIDTFLGQLNTMLYPDDRNVEFFFPYKAMNIVSYLLDHTFVETLDYQEDGVYMKAQCSIKIIEAYKEYLLEDFNEIN